VHPAQVPAAAVEEATIRPRRAVVQEDKDLKAAHPAELQAAVQKAAVHRVVARKVAEAVKAVALMAAARLAVARQVELQAAVHKVAVRTPLSVFQCRVQVCRAQGFPLQAPAVLRAEVEVNRVVVQRIRVVDRLAVRRTRASFEDRAVAEELLVEHQAADRPAEQQVVEPQARWEEVRKVAAKTERRLAAQWAVVRVLPLPALPDRQAVKVAAVLLDLPAALRAKAPAGRRDQAARLVAALSRVAEPIRAEARAAAAVLGQ
jgi:hypothetical protein